jgi:ParB family chromosome partitioning protein
MSAPHQRRGLGRGLGALIPTAPRPPDVAPKAAEPAPDETVGTSADWIGTLLPDDESVTVPDSPAGLVDAPGGVEDVAAGNGAVADRAPSLAEDVPRHRPDPASAAVGPVDEPAETPDRGRAGAHAGSAADAGGAWFAELPLDEIRPNPRQPREVFDEEAMAELVHSITEVGLLQPVVVRPVEDGYELVMGERRWRATRQAGLQTIPAIVRETGDDDLLRDALLENLHRAQLNALEEASAYQQLLDDFGCTHDELASRLGRSRPQISNTLRLLKLPPAVQRRVAAGVLSAGHARALLAVPDAEQQDRLAGRVVAEGISVRSLEELVAVGDASRSPVTRRSRPTAPGVDHLATRLSDRLDTRVRVELGRRKGRITIEFASLPDLERIVELIEASDASTKTQVH